jgi:lipopolysaccharide assembly protein A
MMRVLLLVLLLVMFALGGTIGYFNAQPVRFSYIVGEVEMPLIALLIVEFLVAVALTLLVVLGRMLVLKGEVRRLRRQLQKGEAELANLRQMAVEPTASGTPDASAESR